MSSPTPDCPPEPTNHIVFVPISARSHIRILLQLSLNCLDLHPSLITTILIPRIYTERVDQELALQPAALLECMKARFRVVKIDDGLTEIGGFGMENQVFAKMAPPTVEALILGEVGVGRWKTRPCAFIADTFRVSLWAMVRETLDRLRLPPIPIVQMMSTFGMAMHRFISTDEDGGMCEKIKERYEQNLADGLEEKDAAKKAMRFVQDRLLEWPDLPPMYDYEWTPQAESRVFSAIMITVMSIAFDPDRVKDGIICVSIPELDSASLDRLAQIAGADVFGVGPQFSEHVWKAAVAADEPKSGQAKEDEAHIISFLDEAYRKHGKNSAAYLSLGTAFWPTTRPDIIETVVDSLLALEPPLPFVFATANPDGKLSDTVKQKIHDSGRGLVTDWAPQVKVLQHPATGIFLTHCGVGSLTEAIVCGVPILTMPFAADQPALSAHFTQITPIGRQLNQLASGLAGRTMGTGVHVPGTHEAMRAELAQAWKDMRGEPGVRYRAKTEEVRDVLRKSWEDGGSRQAVMDLSRFFTSH